MERADRPVIRRSGEEVICEMEYVDVTTFRKGKHVFFAARRKFFGGSRLIFRDESRAWAEAHAINTMAVNGVLV